MYAIQTTGIDIHHINFLFFFYHCILIYFMHCVFSAIATLTQCSKVAHFSTSSTHLLIGWTLMRWVAKTTVFAFLLGWWSVLWYSSLVCFTFGPFSLILLHQNPWGSFKLSSIVVWIIWASHSSCQCQYLHTCY